MSRLPFTPPPGYDVAEITDTRMDQIQRESRLQIAVLSVAILAVFAVFVIALRCAHYQAQQAESSAESVEK